MVKKIYRELGGTILTTLDATVSDIEGAVALVKREVAKGETRWSEKIGKYEAWLAKTRQEEAARTRINTTNEILDQCTLLTKLVAHIQPSVTCAPVSRMR